MQVRAGLLCALGVVTCAGPVFAQAQQGWQVSVDFLMVATQGHDVHFGDVFTETQRLTGPVADLRFDYGVTYDPIVPKMERDQSLLVAVAYRGARWGAGARGWRVATSGDVDGRAVSPPPTSNSSTVAGLRFWDHSLIPVTDLRQSSTFSPVPYYADNSLENLRIEGYVERRWITDSTLNVGIRLGAAFASLENLRSEGQSMTTFIVETGGGLTTTTTNDITIDAESEATMNLAGPLVAVAGDSTFGRLRVEWLAGSAVLLGNAETSGTWIDIDDFAETTVGPGGSSSRFEFLRGVLPVEREMRVVVPTIDLQVKASVRLTRTFGLGAGVFSSSWFGLPAAPSFTVPGAWTDIEGTGWKDQERNVGFTAISAFASVGF